MYNSLTTSNIDYCISAVYVAIIITVLPSQCNQHLFIFSALPFKKNISRFLVFVLVLYN